MSRFFALLISLFISTAISGCQSEKEIAKPVDAASPTVLTANPGEVNIITSDIPLFWKMFDRESPLFTKLEVDPQYFQAGTPALSLFYKEKIKSSDAFSSLLNNRFDRRYYENIRANTLQIHQHKDEIITALEAFEKLYPPAKFTDITFVIGNLSTGGVLLPNGQIVIAAEMFSKEPGMNLSFLSPWHRSVLRTPAYLPVIVLHETIHLQQQMFFKPGQNATLLDRALLEGSADFITHQVLDFVLNPQLLEYGDAHEKELWRDFSKSMNQTQYGEWLYNGNAGTPNGRPADLGYYIGYKVAEQFYRQQKDKQKAIREIIRMQTGKEFLQRSGYADARK